MGAIDTEEKIMRKAIKRFSKLECDKLKKAMEESPSVSVEELVEKNSMLQAENKEELYINKFSIPTLYNYVNGKSLAKRETIVKLAALISQVKKVKSGQDYEINPQDIASQYCVSIEEIRSEEYDKEYPKIEVLNQDEFDNLKGEIKEHFFAMGDYEQIILLSFFDYYCGLNINTFYFIYIYYFLNKKNRKQLEDVAYEKSCKTKQQVDILCNQRKLEQIKNCLCMVYALSTFIKQSDNIIKIDTASRWEKYSNKLDELHDDKKNNICQNIRYMMKIIARFIYIPINDFLKLPSEVVTAEESNNIWRMAIVFSLLDHEYGKKEQRTDLLKYASHLYDAQEEKAKATGN